MDDEIRRKLAALDYEDGRLDMVERLKMQTSLAQDGLKALVLVNGGALISLFTLLGNDKVKLSIHGSFLWPAFGCFTLGLVLTIAAYILAFGSQKRYYIQTMHTMWDDQSRSIGGPARDRGEDFGTAGARWEVAGVVSATLALLLFLVGSGLALAGVLPA